VWGRTSVPARLLTPITLVLGIAAAHAWQDSRTRATKTLGILALIASMMITLTLAGPDHGRLLLNFRDGISLWLEWANDVVDLPKGLPSLFHDDRSRMWLKIAIWAASLVTLWIVLRIAGPRDPRAADQGGSERPHYVSWQSIWCAAVALMVAFTLAWRIDGVQPVTPDTAAVNLLRHASPSRSLGYDFRSSHFETSKGLLSSVRIAGDQQRRPVSAPALFSVRDLPAGTYQLHATSRQPAEGTLVARVGSTPLPFFSAASALASTPSADVSFRLSTKVRSLIIDGDAGAARSVSAVELVPIDPAVPLSAADDDSARRAVRYDSADAFFLDEHAYPEPTGFWVAGGRTAALTVASRGGHPSLFVRNAPVDNRITIEAGGDRQELLLGAGEERAVTLPSTTDLRPLRLRITSQSGFRPSTTESGSSDQRYLGGWVEIR
jgi:hypothetical protein